MYPLQTNVCVCCVRCFSLFMVLRFCQSLQARKQRLQLQNSNIRGVGWGKPFAVDRRSSRFCRLRSVLPIGHEVLANMVEDGWRTCPHPPGPLFVSEKAGVSFGGKRSFGGKGRLLPFGGKLARIPRSCSDRIFSSIALCFPFDFERGFPVTSKKCWSSPPIFILSFQNWAEATEATY